MNMLVTAGNTMVLIDRVRGLTNVFTGRTGARIARAARDRGHSVTLLTSHPEVIDPGGGGGLGIEPYRTYDELETLMGREIRSGGYGAVIHSAAVSDYLVGGVYAPERGTCFSTADGVWRSPAGTPRLVSRAAGKVKSDEPELWLRLVRAPKLVDRVRNDWGFRGVLVKFKLEVGVADEPLLAAAEQSRIRSAANFMVANTLEGANDWAFLGPVAGGYERLTRQELPARLIVEIEKEQGEAPVFRG